MSEIYPPSEPKPAPAADPETAPPPKRRRSAASRALGHSPFSSLMMLVLPLVGIGTIGYFLYEAGTFEDYINPKTDPAATRQISRPEIPAPVTAQNKPEISAKPSVPAALNTPNAETEAKIDLPAVPSATPDAAPPVAPQAEQKETADTKDDGGQPPATADISTEKTTMVAPKITRFDRKSRTYIVKAASAERHKAKPDIVFLAKVASEVRLPESEDKIFITADEGAFNRRTEILDLKGNIEVKATNGYDASLETARLWLKESRVVSDRPVVVYMPRGTVAANGVEMLDSGKRVKFLNRARMIIKGRGS